MRHAENIPGVDFTESACRSASRALAIVSSDRVYGFKNSAITGVYLVGVLSSAERTAAVETARSKAAIGTQAAPTPPDQQSEGAEQVEEDLETLFEDGMSERELDGVLDKAVFEWKALGAKPGGMPDQAVTVLKALAKGVQLVVSGAALSKVTPSNAFSQPGRTPTGPVNVVNVFTMSCTCSWYLERGRPCDCLYAAVAHVNHTLLKGLPAEELLRGLWKSVRRRIPHTAEEHGRLPPGTLVTPWPPTRARPAATVGQLLTRK